MDWLTDDDDDDDGAFLIVIVVIMIPVAHAQPLQRIWDYVNAAHTFVWLLSNVASMFDLRARL